MSSNLFSFDNKLLENININTYNIKESANLIKERFKSLDTESKINELLFAIRIIDLTTLSGDDTSVNVQRLCARAINPLRSHLINKLNLNNCYESLRTGAVCVYPSRVVDCVNAFRKLETKEVPIACVATGFPSGQYSLESRLSEIQYAIDCGSHEIDVVINRSLALDGDWNAVYDELKQMRQICDKTGAHLKVIISAGELGSLDYVYKASMTSMSAGAHFIKTSTGKETINATLPIGIVMTRAIADFFYKTGIRIGFKAAGGLKTAQDAIDWITLIKTQLGNEWMTKDLFRIGASSLLNDIESNLFRLVYGREPFNYELSL